MKKNHVPVFLHIPKCAGTYVIGWNMLMMRYYGILNKWNEAPGWNGTLKIVDVIEGGEIVMRAFVWLKGQCPWRLVGTNGAEATIEELIVALPACGFLFSLVIESHGVKLIRRGAAERVCLRVGKKPMYYTIMRSPLDREKALYNYLSSSKSSHEPSYGVIAAENFEEYVSCELADNWVTREIAGVPEDRMVNDVDFCEAKNILKKFVLAEISEVDDVLNEIFGACYNISTNDIPLVWAKDINRNATNIEINDLSDDALEGFNYRTRYDQELYQEFTGNGIVGLSVPFAGEAKKIYTYYEGVFANQSELLTLWKESWIKRGFEAVILTQEDAEKSPYYEEFLDSIKRIHLDVTGGELKDYGKACYMRWLAYSTQADVGAFFVSDYDVINNGFEKTREFSDKLNHLGGYCPCIASGTANQFLGFCKDIINISLKYKDDIKQEYQEKGYVWYHDQEFLVINAEKIKELYNIVPNRKYVTQYEHGTTDLSKADLIHVSHSSVGNAQNQFSDLRGRNASELRVSFVESIVN